jgi:hypothetical protein
VSSSAIFPSNPRIHDPIQYLPAIATMILRMFTRLAILATRAASVIGIFAVAIIATLALALLSLPEALLAQPALPSDPTQAPIGPGLGALAVAGGAYAMRRLRGRKGGEFQE